MVMGYNIKKVWCRDNSVGRSCTKKPLKLSKVPEEAKGEVGIHGAAGDTGKSISVLKSHVKREEKPH